MPTFGRGNAGLSYSEKEYIDNFIDGRDGKFSAETIIDYLKYNRHLRQRVPTIKQVSYYLSRNHRLRKCGYGPHKSGVIYERRI